MIKQVNKNLSDNIFIWHINDIFIFFFISLPDNLVEGTHATALLVCLTKRSSLFGTDDLSDIILEKNFFVSRDSWIKKSHLNENTSTCSSTTRKITGKWQIIVFPIQYCMQWTSDHNFRNEYTTQQKTCFFFNFKMYT